ncbi:MAG: hypothetical protein R3B90_09960 [Planctomycetaceae bacterium]
MSSHISLRRLLAAAVVASGLAFTSTASAGGYHSAPCTYKTITTWEVVQQPVVDWVVKYKPCGTPYRVKVVSYKAVRVPVQKVVKVCY